MGLDKWLKAEKEVKEEDNGSKELNKKDLKQKDTSKKPSIHLIKHILVCPSAKCKYQKIIVKKHLTNKDMLCPRCKKEMKFKN